MKRALILVVLTFLMATAYGQKDVVHLKNGSELRGKVLKNDATGVVLKMRGGSIWNFSAGEVAFVDADGMNTIGAREYENKRVGFYNRTSVGGRFDGPALHTVLGYSFNTHWEVGLGLGIEYYRYESYVPVFVEGRYNFLSTRNSPFVAVNAGQAFLPRYDDPGGFTGTIMAGYDIYTREHFGFMASAGYSFGHPATYSWWYNDFFGAGDQYHRLEIRLGLIFR
jgi:hypothetical protein